MWLYFLLIFSVLIEAAILFIYGSKKNRKKIYLWLVFIQLFIISGFRSQNIGNDTAAYINLFEDVGQVTNVFLMSTRYEIGYIVFNRILYFCNSNSQILIIVTSFINLFVIIRFIYKKSDIIWMSIYLLITFRYFYFTMNAIRHSLAMVIILIAYSFLVKRKNIQFIIMVILASLFHSTAIIFLIIYPLTYLKFDFKGVFITTVSGTIIFLAFNSIMVIFLRYFPQYQHYLGSRYFESGVLANYINIAIQFVILIFGYIIMQSMNQRRNIRVTNKVNEEHLLLYIMLLSVMFSILSIRGSLLDRVASYFSVFIIIFIPKILRMIRDKKLFVICIYLILILAFTYHTIIFIYRPKWNTLFPYEFFWQI